MANSVEDVVNQALVDIGYRHRIADIFEGSPAARAALEVYSQTRDELLDAGEWPLARRANVPLALIKGPPPNGGYNPETPWAPTYPPPGWLYEYGYPDDMLDLRAILPRPDAMFDLDPKPARWRVDNDNSQVNRDGDHMPQVKVILSNVPDALAVYIGSITDPSLWEPGFTAVVISRLGEKLARRLGVGEEVRKSDAADVASTMPAASRSRG